MDSELVAAASIVIALSLKKKKVKLTQKEDSMGTTMVGAQREAWCYQHPTNRAAPRRQKRIQNVSAHDARSVWGTFGIRKQDTVTRDAVPPEFELLTLRIKTVKTDRVLSALKYILILNVDKKMQSRVKCHV